MCQYATTTSLCVTPRTRPPDLCTYLLYQPVIAGYVTDYYYSSTRRRFNGGVCACVFVYERKSKNKTRTPRSLFTHVRSEAAARAPDDEPPVTAACANGVSVSVFYALSLPAEAATCPPACSAPDAKTSCKTLYSRVAEPTLNVQSTPTLPAARDSLTPLGEADERARPHSCLVRVDSCRSNVFDGHSRDWPTITRIFGLQIKNQKRRR